MNPNAIHILEKNIDKINWECLSENPNIFELDKMQWNNDIEQQTQIFYFI